MNRGDTGNVSVDDGDQFDAPQSIQPHGLLLVIDPASDRILQAAGDAEALTGFGGPVVGKTAALVLGVSLAALLERAETAPGRESAYLGSIPGAPPPGGRSPELTLTASQGAGATIVEVTASAPSASAARTLARIRSITESIGGAASLIQACELAAGEVRGITGYDSVVIYRFHADQSGAVVAEAKDDRSPSVLGQHYPASEIPTLARDRYRRGGMQIVPDVTYRPAPLDPAIFPPTGQPLDLSQCTLRGVPPDYLRYLQSRGVGAAICISLMRRGELWGLIACHNGAPRALSHEDQETCRHVGQILSQQIQAREETDDYRLRLELAAARSTLGRTLMVADDPLALLLARGPDLMRIAPSHGVAVCWRDTVSAAGHVPTERQVKRLAAWLRPRLTDGDVFVTDRLSDEYPQGRTFASEASGLLSTLVPGDDPIVLMWFRAEHVEEINRAGNPYEPPRPESSLAGDNSRGNAFAIRPETVRGNSRPWEPVGVDSAREFGARTAIVLQQKRVRDLNALLSEANERLAALASTDGLTGVPNRRAFDERLRGEHARRGRPRRPLALISLDVDFFKEYNDRYGHARGDECLIEIARCLRDGGRASDLAARIGGEEFSVLLPDTDMAGALRVAEPLRARIEALAIPHAGSPLGVVTASFGVASGAHTPQALTQAADEALYEAKRGGRNRVARA